MGFKPTKKDLQRSALCPVGMHLFTVVSTEKPYLNEKGTKIEKVDFETNEGYLVPIWFNDKMLDSLLKFVEAADNIRFDLEKDGDNLPEIELRDYVGKKVAGSVSHRKDNDGKPKAQIDEFFTADSVPF